MAVNINHYTDNIVSSGSTVVVNNLLITSVGSGVTVGSAGITTYFGDGSNLTGISGGSGVFDADNTTNLYSCTITSLPSRTTGDSNFFVGTGAGKGLTSGNNNIGIGTSAGAGIAT
jgi:hypothetical protein